MLHERGAIVALMERLAVVPEASQDRMTTLEAIQVMAPRVKEWREQGHSWDRVREELEKGGFKISTATLVTYFKKVAAGGRRRRRGDGGRRSDGGLPRNGNEAAAPVGGEPAVDAKGRVGEEIHSSSAVNEPVKPPANEPVKPAVTPRATERGLGTDRAGEPAAEPGAKAPSGVGDSEIVARRELEKRRAGFPRSTELEDL